MKGEKLANFSITNGITALIFCVTWLILSFCFNIDNSTGLLTIIYSLVFFVAVILSVLGIIYTFIILPFCIKESKLKWFIGLVLNVVSFIPTGILVAFIGFIIYCFLPK